MMPFHETRELRPFKPEGAPPRLIELVPGEARFDPRPMVKPGRRRLLAWHRRLVIVPDDFGLVSSGGGYPDDWVQSCREERRIRIAWVLIFVSAAAKIGASPVLFSQ